MTTMKLVRTRHIGLMEKSLQTLVNMLANVSQETATTLRDLNDGPTGWTTLEVVCHLRDFDEIFYNRAKMMRDQDNPALPAFDHEQMAIDNNYNEQNLGEALCKLVGSRTKFVEFFKGLSDEEWERGGNHPERDSFSMTDAVMQVGLHDVTHIEQIVRILGKIQ